MSSDCLFCKIVAGDIPASIVYEDEQVMVFKDIYPKAEVHLLTIPRIHLHSLDDMNEEHDALLAHMMRLQAKLAREQGLKGYRNIINTGEDGGQVIFHLHIHLLGGSNLPGFG